MRSSSDRYADQTNRDEDDLADYGDRPRTDHAGADEPYATEGEDRRWPPYLPSWGWGGAWGVVPWASRGDEADERYDEAGDASDGESGADDGGFGSLWDESLITLLIVGGAILFVFPEPATSGLGVLLVTLGVLAWLVDLAM